MTGSHSSLRTPVGSHPSIASQTTAGSSRRLPACIGTGGAGASDSSRRGALDRSGWRSPAATRRRNDVAASTVPRGAPEPQLPNEPIDHVRVQHHRPRAGVDVGVIEAPVHPVAGLGGQLGAAGPGRHDQPPYLRHPCSHYEIGTIGIGWEPPAHPVLDLGVVCHAGHRRGPLRHHKPTLCTSGRSRRPARRPRTEPRRLPSAARATAPLPVTAHPPARRPRPAVPVRHRSRVPTPPPGTARAGPTHGVGPPTPTGPQVPPRYDHASRLDPVRPGGSPTATLCPPGWAPRAPEMSRPEHVHPRGTRRDNGRDGRDVPEHRRTGCRPPPRECRPPEHPGCTAGS